MSTRITRRKLLRLTFFAGGLGSGTFLIAACGGGGAAPTPAAGEGTAVNLELSASDAVDFSTQKLEVEAGSKVSLTFSNKSTNKLFNWVLAQPGRMLRVVTDGAAESEENAYLRPNDANVIAHTKLLKPGESDTITFDAPPPGEYQYFCTFPGYYTRMNGTLTVK